MYILSLAFCIHNFSILGLLFRKIHFSFLQALSMMFHPAYSAKHLFLLIMRYHDYHIHLAKDFGFVYTIVRRAACFLIDLFLSFMSLCTKVGTHLRHIEWHIQVPCCHLSSFNWCSPLCHCDYPYLKHYNYSYTDFSEVHYNSIQKAVLN